MDTTPVDDTVVEPMVVTLFDCCADFVVETESVRETVTELLGVNDEDELRAALGVVVVEAEVQAEEMALADDDAVAQAVREFRGDCDGVSVAEDELLLLDVPVAAATVADTECDAKTVADTEAVNADDGDTAAVLLDVFDAELDADIENEAASLAERAEALAETHARRVADATPDVDTLTVVDALESGEPVYVVLVVLVSENFETVTMADFDASLLVVAQIDGDVVSLPDTVFEPEADCDTENDGDRLGPAERVLDVDARKVPLVLGEPESGKDRWPLGEGKFDSVF